MPLRDKLVEGLEQSVTAHSIETNKADGAQRIQRELSEAQALAARLASADRGFKANPFGDAMLRHAYRREVFDQLDRAIAGDSPAQQVFDERAGVFEDRKVVARPGR